MSVFDRVWHEAMVAILRDDDWGPFVELVERGSEPTPMLMRFIAWQKRPKGRGRPTPPKEFVELVSYARDPKTWQAEQQLRMCRAFGVTIADGRLLPLPPTLDKQVAEAAKRNDLKVTSTLRRRVLRRERKVRKKPIL